MNQGKLDVVKQEMARVKIYILGISEQKWVGMGNGTGRLELQQLKSSSEDSVVGEEDRGAETSVERCKPAVVTAVSALARCLGYPSGSPFVGWVSILHPK